jgi:hypothetical protein
MFTTAEDFHCRRELGPSSYIESKNVTIYAGITRYMPDTRVQNIGELSNPQLANERGFNFTNQLVLVDTPQVISATDRVPAIARPKG